MQVHGRSVGDVHRIPGRIIIALRAPDYCVLVKQIVEEPNGEDLGRSRDVEEECLLAATLGPTVARLSRPLDAGGK
jgi:hypothetical protein